jgi:hypothetical protein
MSTPTAPAPAFVCVYARPKAGKTTDCGYSFPTGLFFATPGALKPLASTCGYDPEARGQVRYIERLADAVKLMPEAKKAGHDAVIADDFSFLVEREWAALERKFTGFTLFGKLREEVESFRDAARYSGLHVVANCWEKAPGVKNGVSVRGGPQLHGDLPEKFPALCDLVLRGGTDAMRPGPHKGVYLCSPNDDAYVMGDRHGIAPPIGPMNIAEILRLAGYPIRRLPEASWQEGMVDAASGLILEAPPAETVERQRTVLSRVVDKLAAQNIDGKLIAWTLRDILDRVALRRMHAARWSAQGVLTSFTGA